MTGKTEPGATVNVYDKDGNEVGTGTADADGNFTIEIPASVGPEADLTVKAENEAGSSEGTVKTPAISGAIVVNEMKEFTTLITGTAPKGTEKVKLTVNGKDLVLGNVNADGTFEFDRKYVYDAQGNKKLLGAGDIVRVTVADNGKQNYYAEQAVTATEVAPVVIENVDKATYTITGTTDASVTKVQLSVNGKALATYDVVDGEFTITRKYVYDADGNKKILGAGDVITVRNYEKLKDGQASITVPAD